MIIAAGILWGCMGIFVRALTAYGFTSPQITAIRLTSAAILLWLFALITKPKQLKIHPRDLFWMALLGLASLLAMTMCYFTAIQLTSLSIASILLYTAPAMVLIMSAIFFREKLTAGKLIALILAIAGCVLVSGSSGEDSLSLPGLLTGLGSGFAYALYSIIGKVVLKKYPPMTVTTYAFSFAAIGALLVCRPLQLIRIAAAKPDLLLLILLISIGLLSAALPYNLYSAALQHIEAGKASIMASTEPLVATLCGFLLYKESLTPLQLAGIALILGAIVLLNSKSPRPKGKSS